MKHKMKQTFVLGLSVLFLFSGSAVPAFANSAQTHFEGVDSTGAIMTDKESPIIVESELLTFDIAEFPKSYYGDDDTEAFTAYNAKVTAEYTLYNPSEYTITAKLLFPFGNAPMYADGYYDEETNERKKFDDTQKFDITVNGKTVEKKIRHTLSYIHSQFELEKDLSLLADGFISDTFYRPDLPVTKYTYKVSDVDTEKYQAADVGFDVPKGIDDYRIYFPEQNGMHTQKDGDLRIHTGVSENGREMELFVFGAPFTTMPVWKAYENGGVDDEEEIYGKVELVRTETFTFKDFALANRGEESAISENDWYNAVVAELNNSHKSTPDYPAVYCERYHYNFDNNLMRWYEYEITLASGERIINAVTAPMYPAIDLDYEPDIFKYVYLLSPAKTWRSFGELEIMINTPYYVTESNIEGFTKTESGYSLKLDGLPAGELNFTLSTSEKTTQSPKSISMTGMIISFVLAGICLVMSIFQFVEKGFCFNNAYLYASKQEREKMDKSPHYRQSAIVFLMLFLVFVSLGIYEATHIQWFLILEIVVIVVVIVYAVVSSIRINQK
ncbi:MAG: DUF3784 domain-containing protein [Faecalimonas sp.]|nr:DUF3784 domain-containing protein [Faecalimonas sp.]